MPRPGAPAAKDNSVHRRCSTRPAARQLPLPHARIDGAEASCVASLYLGFFSVRGAQEHPTLLQCRRNHRAMQRKTLLLAVYGPISGKPEIGGRPSVEKGRHTMNCVA